MDVKNINKIVALMLCVNATIINAQPTNFKHFTASINTAQSNNSSSSDSPSKSSEENNFDNTTQKNLLDQQQKHLLNVLREIQNQEVALSLPKNSLNPLAQVIINNYPKEIKETLLKFVELSGSARLRLKAYKGSLDKEEKVELLRSAKKLVTEATALSAKLLEVSVGRDELLEDITKLSENLSFKESYDATNELLSFPERFKFLRLIPPIVLHSLSLWENKTQNDEYIFNLRNAFGTREPRLLALQDSPLGLSQEVQNNENNTTIKDLLWYAALPILAAKHSPEEHAFNLKNPQQLVCFGASIMQYLKPLINLTPRLQELFYIRKSPRDKVIEAGAGLIGYGAVLGDLLINSSKRYLSKKNSYPFSQKNLNLLKIKSKEWQATLKAQEEENTATA